MSVHYEYFDSADVPQYGDNPTMTSNGRGLRDVVEFPPNVPIQLVLKYARSKTVESRRGPRAMFTTQDNRVMFLDRDIAFRIEKLAIKPGELFWLARKHSGEKGALETWDIWLDPATERAREKRSAPLPPPASYSPEQAQPAAEGVTLSDSHDSAKKAGAIEGPPASDVKKWATCSDGSSSQIHLGWAQLCLSTANTLTDIYAAALAHAQKHGGSVRNEDVRTMVVTAFIHHTKGPNHA